jgi:hypothetical protein
MKNYIHFLVISVFLMVFMVFPVIADEPPDPGGDPNTGGGTPVANISLEGGLLSLLVYGMVYGTRKVFRDPGDEK